MIAQMFQVSNSQEHLFYNLAVEKVLLAELCLNLYHDG